MAQVDYFLKLDGIKGESTDQKHGGEIDVESWSWGETQTTSPVGAGRGAGKVSMQDFHFVMRTNKASPTLFLACAEGKHFPSAVLTARKAGEKQQDYMTIKLSDVLVSSYQTGGSNGDPIPVDSISLNFAKLEFEYKEQKPDGTLGGSVKTGYDAKKNVKV